MVSIEPEIISNFFGFKITNTLLATFLVDFLLVSGIFIIRKNLSAIPNLFQNATETIIEYLYSMAEQISGKFTANIFPWFASFFFVIFFSNIVGLMPGFGTIGFFHTEEGKKVLVPLLRAATSDFNTTLALATISLVATHTLSIKYNGIVNYLKRYFSFNPIFLFVGLLEIISEFTKLLSLSFRLFGNIYAGEVVLATISSLFAFVAPIPFLLLETIVAFVQALVFAMLTMVFMSIMINPHTEGGGH
ncbi:MAG: ATP synthase F0 subunit A [Candidatus Levybacteria bacterium CG10_big_fil_rev_8_21_14_0_10_36_30]|nr:MAG: ATP synthase F0 subunit A [Candidatus Levybacteria bacterium CG10_big_fil_rev_8_21_14_0_10_36_30]